MFIRPFYRIKNGKRHAYWALMESYRTERGPRQRMVTCLGQLDERGRLGVKEAAERNHSKPRQKRLFDDVEPDWVEVDVRRIRVENRQDFGKPWLGLELIRQLGLKDFLEHTIRGMILEETYIQLPEAEAAFRIHKSDLSIRPIWHQKEDRVLAHILVCFLAYVLWKTLAQRCLRAGLGHEPRRVFDELGKIHMVDVVLPTRDGREIRRRCITRPTEHQAILLHHLHLTLPETPQTGCV